MKLNRIKSYMWALVAAFALGISSTSCVNDLDVENINPQSNPNFDADKLFNKIYSSFVLTGQTGAAGSGDIADADEGRSQFTRMNWNLNELCTDEAHWYWYKNDGYEYVEKQTYGADDVVSQGLYYRIYFTITLCNYYLDQVAEDGTDETAARRAEVRFIRAYNYFTVMDLYGNGPFTQTFDNENGVYYTRKQFYEFVESELKSIEGDLKDAGENTYGRIDKVADWLLLARLYLNAQVYTGTAQWTLAKEYAEKVIGNNYYELFENDPNKTDANGRHYASTNPSTGENYTAYQMLFLADNDETNAKKEDIFPVIHTGLTTRSYGGMNSIIMGAYSAEMNADVPSGTTAGWGKCYCVRGTLVDLFLKGVEADNVHKPSEMAHLANDDRALFYGVEGGRKITDMDSQSEGYGCVKFRNVRSDGQATSLPNDAFVDTDQPLMRIAEAYLTLAEAAYRLGDAGTAARNINILRDRAGAADVESASLSLSTIRDEWAKEFWCEGRRRMDLVRFNNFGGQSEYKWEFMHGVADGEKFEAFRNIFGIPTADITNNSNLKQNPGY